MKIPEGEDTPPALAITLMPFACRSFPLSFLAEGELCHPKVALVSVLDLDSNMLRG